jgi:hypothetical protein
MEAYLKPALVRIRDADYRQIFGTGFLAAPQHIVTCAHVVADALRVARSSHERPTAPVHLDFPLLPQHPACVAEVVHWDVAHDIAVLVTQGSPPQDSQPVPLLDTEAISLWGHPIGVLGFPAASDEGEWARGELLGPRADGWVQLNDTQQHGYFVKRGFSGTPVWDHELGGVVGLVVAAHAAAQVAYIIPAHVVLAALAGLIEPSNKEQPMGVAKTYRLGVLEIQFHEQGSRWRLVVVNTSSTPLRDVALELTPPRDILCSPDYLELGYLPASGTSHAIDWSLTPIAAHSAPGRLAYLQERIADIDRLIQELEAERDLAGDPVARQRLQRRIDQQNGFRTGYSKEIETLKGRLSTSITLTVSYLASTQAQPESHRTTATFTLKPEEGQQQR